MSFLPLCSWCVWGQTASLMLTQLQNFPSQRVFPHRADVGCLSRPWFKAAPRHKDMKYSQTFQRSPLKRTRVWPGLDQQGLQCKHTPGIVYYWFLITSLRIRLAAVVVKTVLTTIGVFFLFQSLCPGSMNSFTPHLMWKYQCGGLLHVDSCSLRRLQTLVVTQSSNQPPPASLIHFMSQIYSLLDLRPRSPQSSCCCCYSFTHAVGPDIFPHTRLLFHPLRETQSNVLL